MPGPIDNKYNSTPSDQPEPDSGVGGDYDPEFGGLQDEGDAATGGDIGGITGDEFVTEGDDFGGGSGVPPAPTDPDSFHAWLRELKVSGDITEAQFQQYSSQVEATFGLSRAGQEAALSRLGSEIQAQFATDIVESETETQTEGVDDVKKELEDLKDEIEDSENLTEDEQIELSAEVDTLLNDMELNADKPENIDPESIRGDIEDIRTRLNEANQFTPALKGLADAAGVEVEVLKAKAEAKDIILDNLAVPPPMNVMEFLIEEIPGLKEKVEAVEDAVNERTTFYEEASAQAAATNSSNKRCTSDSSDGVAGFQDLYDLMYHQDDKSKEVKSAMEEFNTALIPILEALYYPGQDVKPVETTGFTGWEKSHQEYLNADKISIGGTAVDLFNATDGTLQSTTTADEEPGITIPSIARDEEGAGSWEGSNGGLRTYDSSISWDSYDSDDGY